MLCINLTNLRQLQDRANNKLEALIFFATKETTRA